MYYRELNKTTTPDLYYILRISELIDQLGMAKYLSELDLNKGFYLVPMVEEDQEKTTFCFPWGKYQFIVMPFGLRNAPSIFCFCITLFYFALHYYIYLILLSLILTSTGSNTVEGKGVPSTTSPVVVQRGNAASVLGSVGGQLGLDLLIINVVFT